MASSSQDGLFSAAGRRHAASRAPLAERLRPTSLAEVVGQEELLAPGGLLRQEVADRRLGSLLLWGGPGCGKTTLARVLAEEAGYSFQPLSAVSAGVALLRETLARAEQRLGARGQPTLLFVDEIHRFHKGQQDALLHEVEDGRVTLVGATTENPARSVIAALLSRCRLLRLQPLGHAACEGLVDRALSDTERGLGRAGVVLDDEARRELVVDAGGDGRRLLNQLERAVQLAAGSGREVVAVADVHAARGERVPTHDKAGDAYYDLLSALHKSLRGSDPDAAAYYVQRLLVAGEDPRVVARRLVRMASEDVGLADPRALGMALDSLRAVEFLGLPEGDAALVQAAIYLALAPKSDAVYRASGAAREAVHRHGAAPVPLDLRNATDALARQAGHGRGYLNPHRAPGALTPQVHLPDVLARQRFYQPTDRGFEARIAERLVELRRQRDAADRQDGEAGRSSTGA